MERDLDAKVADETALSDSQDEVIIAKPGSRASAIIVQKIPSDKTDAFLKWQRGIAHATTAFAGYERTEVYPPVEGAQEEWVTILHFKNHADLEQWLKSDTRAEWANRFHEEFGEFELKKLGTGLGILFPPTQTPIPDWKLMMIVVLGLYPAIMVLNNTVLVPLRVLPFPTQMLIGNIVTASCLQWFIIPWTMKAFKWWIQPPSDKQERLRTNLLGAVVIMIVLTVIDVICMALKL